MSRRRVDRLEDSLSPKQAVIHWLGDAHDFGTLPAYVESLIDQPETAQPFIALPAQVAKATYESMRRERTAAIKAATNEAVGDTVFLIELVIGLNVHVEETLRFERLRSAALYWWSRALDPERRAKGDPKDVAHQDWERGVATLHGVLLGTERARAAAEARYLDAHDCLFPELAARWRDLCAAADLLAEGEHSPDEEATREGEQSVRRAVLMARADGLEASGQQLAADAMAQRVVRLTDMTAPEGADG